MNKLTIHYEETAFTMAAQQNRRDLHKQVHHHMSNGHSSADRDWVYSVTPMPGNRSMVLITARGAALGEHLEKEAGQLSVSRGQTLTLDLSIDGEMRVDEGNQRPVEESELERFVSTKLSNRGMALVSMHSLGARAIRVWRRSGAFWVNERLVRATVTVDDPGAFAGAFVSGIGRKRAYGLGMMEVVDDASE